MRIALISDIHSNLTALEAVLADIERAGVDQIVFLGDAATLGPHPREVVAHLRALCAKMRALRQALSACDIPGMDDVFETWVARFSPAGK